MARRRGHGAPEFFPGAGELFLMNPFSLMRRVTEEMNRVFGQQGLSAGGDGMTWAPAIEVAQREGKLEISAELPGLKPDDVKITVEDDVLILEGERREQKEEDGDGVRRTEIRYGRFYRAIPLPEGAKTDQAQARFDNGVLRIAVPIEQQAAQRRQIPVAGSTGQTGSKGGESGGKRAA